MQFKKSTLALAVITALGTGSALAASTGLNLDTGTGTAIYASEITVSGSGTVLSQTTAPGILSADTAKLGFTFGAGVPAFVRIDLSNGAKFAGIPTLAVVDSNVSNSSAPTIVVSQGGDAESYVIFSVTPIPATDQLLETGPVTFSALQTAPSGVKVVNQNTVTLTYGLYETGTLAANKQTPLKTASGPYIGFKPAIDFSIDSAYTTIASVSAVPAFTQFLNGATTTQARLGGVNFKLASPTPVLATGSKPSSLADILADGTSYAVAGDFTVRAATTPVTLTDDYGCTGEIRSFTSVTDTLATYTPAVAFTSGFDSDDYVCYSVNGTAAIPASSYNITLNPVAKSGFTVAAKTLNPLGTIVRDGTTLQAPVVQYPPGFSGRIFLANSGTVDAPYTTTFLPDVATTVGPPGAGATGTIPAGKHILVDVSTIFTVTAGPPRGSLIVNVAGQPGNIEGAYQLYNSAAGTLTNSTMMTPNRSDFLYYMP